MRKFDACRGFNMILGYVMGSSEFRLKSGKGFESKVRAIEWPARIADLALTQKRNYLSVFMRSDAAYV